MPRSTDLRLRWPDPRWALPLLALVLAACGSADLGVQNVAETLNQPGGSGMKSGTLSIVLSAALLLVVPLVTWAWLNNSLVAKEEATYGAWAQVESHYQRRQDLVPQLVETVTRYLRHERETLSEVTAQRRAGGESLEKAMADLAAAQRETAIQLDSLGGKPPEDDAALRRLALTEQQVGTGVRRLLAVAEAYPELRSADQFLELQAQLEGTENRINVARLQFNDAVRAYNGSIRKLPAALVAQARGFQRKAYFQADEGARAAKPLGFDGPFASE